MNESGRIGAYHGSPHSFDAFSMGKIGTGEGAQSYGHGLYFAENRGVAESYRPHTPYPSLAYGREGEKWVLREFTGNGQSVVRGSFTTKAQAAKATSDILATAQRPGHTYKVSINAEPHQFLDWDKPLSEQPNVMRHLAQSDVAPFGRRSLGWQNAPEGLWEKSMQQHTGEELYRSLDTHQLDPAGQAHASAQLNAAGIKGIRYLDQGSRGHQVKLTQNGAPYETTPHQFPSRAAAEAFAATKKAEGFGTEIIQEGTHNYVVFDDKIIEILNSGVSGTQMLAALTGLGLSAAVAQKLIEAHHRSAQP